MQVNVDVKLSRIQKALENFAYNDVRKASRYAINRTLLTMRKTAIDQIRRNLDLGARKMQRDKNKYLKLVKATPASTLSTMWGSISFSEVSISMMEFVIGGKNIKTQKGIKVKNRRMIRTKVKPGRITTLRRAFLQKGPRSSNVEVFVRRRAGGFKVLRVNSIASRVTKEGVIPRLQVVAERRFRDLFFQYLRNKQSSYDVGR